VRATLAALQQLKTAPQVAELRGKEVEQMVGKRLAAAYKGKEESSPQSGGGAGGSSNGGAGVAPVGAGGARAPERAQGA
jgi:hypothetical protein